MPEKQDTEQLNGFLQEPFVDPQTYTPQPLDIGRMYLEILKQVQKVGEADNSQ